MHFRMENHVAPLPGSLIAFLLVSSLLGCPEGCPLSRAGTPCWLFGLPHREGSSHEREGGTVPFVTFLHPALTVCKSLGESGLCRFVSLGVPGHFPRPHSYVTS